MSDSNLHARALEAVRAAGQRAMRGRPTVDDTLILAEIAAAGLALRAAIPHAIILAQLADLCDQLDLAMGAVRETEIQDDARKVRMAQLAYDARLRAALGTGTSAPDAGAVAGAAG